MSTPPAEQKVICGAKSHEGTLTFTLLNLDLKVEPQLEYTDEYSDDAPDRAGSAVKGEVKFSGTVELAGQPGAGARPRPDGKEPSTPHRRARARSARLKHHGLGLFLFFALSLTV